MSVRVRLLGGLSVDGLDERHLGSRKGRTLLKVLALARGAPVPVDTIADVLWGDEPPARPGEQVGVLVSRLRGVLGTDRITRSDAGYALVVDWLDVAEVSALADAGGRALAEGRVGAARAAARAALALARGPLLPDEDATWVHAERAAAEAVVGHARSVAMEAARLEGDHATVAAIGESALAHDPYDEEVLRSLMASHLATGRPAAALAAYARVRTRLAEDLGVSPTAATEDLHTAALAATESGAVPPGSSPADGVPGVAGRRRELAALDAAFADAAAGDTPLLVIEGEPGIGKTTLVEGWLAAGRARGAVVLHGRCDELGRDLPLQPVSDALAEHLRGLDAGAAAEVVGGDGSALAPLLGPVSGTSATVLAPAEEGRAAMFAGLTSAISRIGRPAVLVVDDLHLAGPSTLAWFSFARRRCPGALLLATTRVPLPLEATAVLRLQPLGLDEVGEVHGPERAAELHEKSGGNPLLLTAIATEEVASDGGAASSAGPSVRAAVGRQAASLGEAAATTVRTAAVLGMDCDLDLVALVRRLPLLDVLAHLEHAAAAGLMAPRGSTFRFRHDLVRRSLEADVSGARRAVIHAGAARALADRPTPDVLAVAVHADAGGDRPLAAASYRDAGAAAAARFDLEAAEAHLTRALDLDPSPGTFAARARVRMSRLELDLAAADAAAAVGAGGGAEAFETAGWVAYYQRRYDDALACAEQALGDATDESLRVSGLALAGRVRHGRGDLAGAARCLDDTFDEAPFAVRGVAEVWLGQLRNHQGRPLDALGALARAGAAPDALAHPWAPLHLRFNRVMALGQLGRVEEALSVADELDAAVHRSGQVGQRFGGAAANVRGWVLRWCGRWEEADESNQRAWELMGGAGGPAADGLAEAYYVSLLDLADGRLLHGDPAGAARFCDAAAPVDTWTGTMAWHQRHRLGLLRARLALPDDPDRAAELASAVAGDAAARGARRYELLGRAVLALADRSVPAERVAPVVAGLTGCAVLDGWPLVASLAAARGVREWEQHAERCMAQIVATSGAGAEVAARHLSRVRDVALAVPPAGR